MLTLLLVLVAGGGPQYPGGAKPTPLSQVAPVDESVVLNACSTETLRLSRRCLFDARPAKSTTEAQLKQQARDNVALAQRVGGLLCKQRLEVLAVNAKERATRTAACAKRIDAALADCSLAGEEALLDADGRFSTRARACYGSLADALQLSDVPVPRESGVEVTAN